MQRPVVAIVQARMGSTRHPGKVLEPVTGVSMLEYMLGRVLRAETLDEVVVATSARELDDPIEAAAQRAQVKTFRGSETDVLSRFLGAAEAAAASTIVRLTADCPLIDPAVIDAAVRAYEAAAPPVDLVTTAPPAGRTYPDGMDVEVTSRAALARAAAGATPEDREHVTLRLHQPPFTVLPLHLSEDLASIRLTVDFKEDVDRVRWIAESLAGSGADPTLGAILGLLGESAEIAPRAS